MLCQLSIENIALIDKLNLELKNGLNILSGETGAGKSIIIDSLNFVLGERADKSLIRFGTDRATVEAVFEDYLTPSVQAYLDDLGIDVGGDVLFIGHNALGLDFLLGFLGERGAAGQREHENQQHGEKLLHDSDFLSICRLFPPLLQRTRLLYIERRAKSITFH